MSTLRDRVHDALAAHDPSDAAAAADFAAIVARARAAEEGRRRGVWRLAAPAVVVVGALGAAVVVFAVRTSKPPVGAASPKAMHLYVHVTGAPESRAFTMDLDPKGGI